MNKKNLRQEKGITLIALVITIIILLILAMVTIKAVTNRSVLDHAERVPEDTKIGEEKEITQRAYLTAKMRVLASGVTSQMMQEELDAIVGLGANGESKIEVDDNADGSITVTFKETMHYYVVDGTLAEKVETKPKLAVRAKDLTKDDYGKIITNYTCQNADIQTGLQEANIAWKILYADDENIYLTVSDYIPLDYVPYAKGDTSKNKPTNSNATYPRGASFNNIISYYQGTDNIVDVRLKALNSKWTAFLEEKSKKGTNNTSKAIAYMFDQEAWKGFSCSKADYVIGGMTLELLFKSYNNKYNNENEVYQTKVETASGYKISKDSGVNWACYYSGMLRTSDNTYVVNSSRNATGAWIASSSASGGDMYRTQSIGKICDGFTTSSDYGFRPVVCLSNTTRLIDNENNTFSIR